MANGKNVLTRNPAEPTWVGHLPMPRTADEAVDNGTRWLSWHQPGWWNGHGAQRVWDGHIDVDLLDLADGTQCVLGQLRGSYFDAWDECRHMADFDAVKLGFNLADEDTGQPYGFAELTDAWRERIDELRTQEAIREEQRRRRNVWYRRALRLGRRV